MELVVGDCARGWIWAKGWNVNEGVKNDGFNESATRNAPARDQTSCAVGPGAAAGFLGSSTAAALLLAKPKRPPLRAIVAVVSAAATTGRGAGKGLRPSASSSCSRFERPCAP